MGLKVYKCPVPVRFEFKVVKLVKEENSALNQIKEVTAKTQI